MKMKAKQKQMLSELRNDSRQHISDIAGKLNLARSTVHDYNKILQHYIRQHTTLIDFAKLGYSLRMSFIFRISSKRIPQFLLKNKHIDSIQRINDKNTLMVWGFFRSMNEAYEFKEMLEDKGIKDIEMHDIIEEVEKEKMFSENFPDFPQ